MEPSPTQIDLIMVAVAIGLFWHVTKRSNLMQRRQVFAHMLDVARDGFVFGTGLGYALALIGYPMTLMDLIRCSAYGMIMLTLRWYMQARIR